MSDTNHSSPAPAPDTSDLAELKEMCADLRAQAQTLRIALVVVAVAISGFFWLEIRRNGQSLTLLRPQAAQVVEASKNMDPAANRFIGQLVEFSKTHPDFVAILKKYPIQVTATGATGATAPPATGTPAAPKKP